MGLLDALKGKKPQVTITAEPADPLLGQEVRVRVTVSGELDDKVQGAKAGLRCVNDYLVREHDHGDDDDHQVREVWRSVDLHEQAIDVPPVLGDHDFTFVVPEGLPPSSHQAVSWWAWATVDRRRGIDASAKQQLAVRLPADGLPLERRAYGTGDGGIAFADAPASIRAGEVLEGSFTVTPPDDVKATDVRVRLTRTRTYLPDKIVKRDHFGETKLQGAVQLAAGQTTSFPFALQVPAGAGPTATAPETVVDWRVTAIVARRMRGDFEVSAPVDVYDG